MRPVIAAAIVALSVALAYAQKPAINLMQEKPKDPRIEEYYRAVDQDYKDATQKIPDQKKKGSDPWGNLRSVEPAKK